MVDPISTFAKQFTPVEGGYLFYPSRKSGGKLVTPEEFERLMENWRRVAGTKGRWKSVGAIVLAITLWLLLSQLLRAPSWADEVIVPAVAVGIVAWLLWASFAPQRLVRDRPAVAPPRPLPQARREARAMLKWPTVLVVTLLSGAIFLGCLLSPHRTFGDWAWLVGSGAMFALYLWVGFMKLRDAMGARR